MKEEQKKLITEIMNDDAKDGLYISPTKSNADMNIGFTDQWKDTPLNIGGQTKQTAVEWLVEQIKSDQNQKALSANEWMEVIEQAKQMEKEQIMQAVYDSMGTNFDPNMGRAEQYYNETYGNKS